MTKKELMQILEQYADDDVLIFGDYHREYAIRGAAKYGDDIIVHLDDKPVLNKYYITNDYKVGICGEFAAPTDKLMGSLTFWNKNMAYIFANRYYELRNEKEDI